ncbi:MAG: DMT family transporter [Chloroflexi bacterium]|nr:MAG: DMT family transporter [Chloroflexota bacterium]
MTRYRIIGVALILISSIAYGAMPIFARLAYADGTSATTLLFMRFGLAALLLLAYMFASRTPFPRGKTLLGLVLLGVIGYVGQSLAYFLAIEMAPASLVALLLYLSPVFVTAGAFLFLRERITVVKIGALGLALAGAVLTVSAGSAMGNGNASAIQMGIMLGVLAALIGAVYTLAGSRVLRAVPTIPATTVIISSTAMVYTGISSAQGFSFPAHWTGYAAIAALATISTVFAIGAFLAGLQRVGPANASTLAVLEPVASVALAAVILGERLYPEQIFGGLLIAGAVVLISRNRE